MWKPVLASLVAFAVAGALWGENHARPQPQAAKAVANRYVLQNSGKVVLDRLTGLHWQQGFSAKTMDGDAAVEWCAKNSGSLPGLGWRLPTVRELWTITDRQASAPAVDSVFAGTPPDYFWSSTVAFNIPINKGIVWLINMGYGNGNFTTVFEIKNVRCVR